MARKHRPTYKHLPFSHVRHVQEVCPSAMCTSSHGQEADSPSACCPMGAAEPSRPMRPRPSPVLGVQTASAPLAGNIFQGNWMENENPRRASWGCPRAEFQACQLYSLNSAAYPMLGVAGPPVTEWRAHHGVPVGTWRPHRSTAAPSGLQDP